MKIIMKKVPQMINLLTYKYIHMNTKLMTLGLALSLNFGVLAQKKEVKNAESAIEENKFEEALKELDNAKELGIMNENEKWVVRFHIAKAKAYLGPNNGENQALDKIKMAADSYKEALAKEPENELAKVGMQNLRSALVSSAINDQNNDDFLGSKEKLYTAYQLNRNDTVYLYYAAGSAINSQKYEDAIAYYNELLEIGYDGSKIKYYAVNAETQEREVFDDKNYRDLMVKSGSYTDPQDEKSPSVKAEIAKNISRLYIQLDQPEKAIEAIGLARDLDPDDITMIQAEADLYYQLGNIQKYKELMTLVKEKAPDDAMVYYNLGVSSEQLEDVPAAIEFYKKAIELDPEYINSYLNLSSVILSKERAIVDQMNELGMSAADNKKYDQLNEEKKQLYQQVLPYLQAAFKVDSNNKGVVQTLMNIHYQLGNDAEAKKMKEKIDEMK